MKGIVDLVYLYLNVVCEVFDIGPTNAWVKPFYAIIDRLGKVFTKTPG